MIRKKKKRETKKTEEKGEWNNMDHISQCEKNRNSRFDRTLSETMSKKRYFFFEFGNLFFQCEIWLRKVLVWPMLQYLGEFSKFNEGWFLILWKRLSKLDTVLKMLHRFECGMKKQVRMFSIEIDYDFLVSLICKIANFRLFSWKQSKKQGGILKPFHFCRIFFFSSFQLEKKKKRIGNDSIQNRMVLKMWQQFEMFSSAFFFFFFFFCEKKKKKNWKKCFFFIFFMFLAMSSAL